MTQLKAILFSPPKSFEPNTLAELQRLVNEKDRKIEALYAKIKEQNRVIGALTKQRK